MPYQGVAAKTIKRFITGNGNASKSAVIAAIKNKGFTPSDDNEADSLALLFYAMNLNNNINNLSSLEAY